MFTDEDLHRHAAESLDQADALLFGRVTYEMMEAAFRPPVPTDALSAASRTERHRSLKRKVDQLLG
jgi:dihydrofolate reductase